MSIRMDQYVGLPDAASSFLDENAAMVPSIVCPNCGIVISEKKDSWVTEKYYEGMFDEKYYMTAYHLKDGTVVREELQAAPWNSGPIIFLKLVKSNGKVLFKWSKDKMQEYL